MMGYIKLIFGLLCIIYGVAAIETAPIDNVNWIGIVIVIAGTMNFYSGIKAIDD